MLSRLTARSSRAMPPRKPASHPYRLRGSRSPTQARAHGPGPGDQSPAPGRRGPSTSTAGWPPGPASRGIRYAPHGLLDRDHPGKLGIVVLLQTPAEDNNYQPGGGLR